MGFIKAAVAIILILCLLTIGFMVYDVYFDDEDCECVPDVDIDFNFTIDNKTAGDYVKDKVKVGIGERINQNGV